MITTNNQTMTLSSPKSLHQLGNARLSCFVGYSVSTQTVSLPIKKSKAHINEIIINSLERSLKENADVWAELSRH